MANTPHQAGHATVDDSAPCYCEYHQINGTWYCHHADPPSGSYCRSQVHKNGNTATYTCFDPLPIPSSMMPHEQCGEYCRYAYVGGNYYLVEGACGCGNHCPTDLMAHLKKADRALYKFLSDKPAILGVIIHPTCPDRAPVKKAKTRKKSKPRPTQRKTAKR